MKTSKIFILVTILLLSSLLASCTGGVGVASSWPGLTVDAEETTVYFAYQAHVYAINLDNGTEKWRFPEKPNNKVSFYASPAFTEDGQLVIGGYDHIFYSINPTNGQQNWTFDDSAQGYHYISAPLTMEENIFAPSGDTFLYTLDLAGNLRWSYETADALWSLPVTDGKTVFLSAMDHHVYALNPENGNLIWKSEELGGALVGNPTLSDKGALYVGTLNSELVALDTSTGKVLWRTPAEGWVWSGPALDGETLYFGDMEGNVFAVNASNGAVLWQKQTGEAELRAITGTPLVVGDTLYFCSQAGILYAVDKANGNPRWNKVLGGEIYPGPVLAGDVILIAPSKTDALLIAVDLEGNLKWSFIPVKAK